MHFLVNTNQLCSPLGLVTWTLRVMVPSHSGQTLKVCPDPTAAGPFARERLWEQEAVLTEEAILLVILGEGPGTLEGQSTLWGWMEGLSPALAPAGAGY